MKKLIIFDLDGTLLNTIADLGNACNYALKQAGYVEHPLTAYNYMVGNGVRRLMERAAPDASPEVIDSLSSEISVHIMMNTAWTARSLIPVCLNFWKLL